MEWLWYPHLLVQLLQISLLDFTKRNSIKINTAYCDKFLRNTPRNLIWNNIEYILYNVERRAIATRFGLAQGSHQATCTKM